MEVLVRAREGWWTASVEGAEGACVLRVAAGDAGMNAMDGMSGWWKIGSLTTVGIGNMDDDEGVHQVERKEKWHGVNQVQGNELHC